MTEFTIESQKIPNEEGREFILKSFANLTPEETLVILDQSDIQPLIDQMKAVFGNLCKYEYLEKGPALWRVRFIKKSSNSCCGFCGS